uniref:Paralemmin 3 n=1 Tax=Ornithorhynchus anatinus TaxID=9258 RepID=A0A6I8NW92_ORNAN
DPTPAPALVFSLYRAMAESSLYRERLEVIGEKRRLQEEIRTTRRELEEEKLRVLRLKRKFLRERWLMAGTPHPPEGPEQEAISPVDQSEARIEQLEENLFTLQAELQLLQSASTGAQPKASGRPTWRKLTVPRSLSQAAMEATPADKEEVEKRASLPATPVGKAPEPSVPQTAQHPGDLGGEVGGGTSPLKEWGAADGSSSEPNGPCPMPSPTKTEPDQKEAPGGREIDIKEGPGSPEESAREEMGNIEGNSREGIAAMEKEAEEEGREEILREELKSTQGRARERLEAMVGSAREELGGLEGDLSEEMGATGRAIREEKEGLEDVGIKDLAREGLENKQEITREDSAEEGAGDREGRVGTGEEGTIIWVERVVITDEEDEVAAAGAEMTECNELAAEDSKMAVEKNEGPDEEKEGPAEGSGGRKPEEPEAELGSREPGEAQGLESEQKGQEEEEEEEEEEGEEEEEEEEEGGREQGLQDVVFPGDSEALPGDEVPPQDSDPPQLQRRDPAPSLEQLPGLSAEPLEHQPLLPRIHTGAPYPNPSTHLVPTYAAAPAPARRPEPQQEGEESNGPKQKSCQCCSVM